MTRAFDPDIGPVVSVTVSDPYSSRPEFDSPRIEKVTMLLDTGATDSALKGYIIDCLGLSVLGLHGVHSWGPDAEPSLQHSADLEIHLDFDEVKEFMDWKLFRFRPDYDKIDGVIGRDILNFSKFALDGPGRQFTLEF